MRTWYGAPAYFVLGAVHAIVFWVTVSFLTPFVLLVGFFNDRRRLLHDMLVGTVVINNAARAQALRAPRRPRAERDKPFDGTPRARAILRRDRQSPAPFGTPVTQHSRNTPQFYLTAPSPCPYLPGQEERKVFTHLVGERAAELNDLLTHGGFRRSQSIAYRPACETCRACVSVRVVADDFRPTPQHAPRCSSATPTSSATCAARCRPPSNIRCSAPISTPATATAAWPT